jgi:KaiC/GvpD/RAD55 family RecA-like ATPase
VESFADCYINLSFLREAGRRTRAVEIVKMRGSSHEHTAVPSSITSHGFVVGEGESKKKQKKVHPDG